MAFLLGGSASPKRKQRTPKSTLFEPTDAGPSPPLPLSQDALRVQKLTSSASNSPLNSARQQASPTHSAFPFPPGPLSPGLLSPPSLLSPGLTGLKHYQNVTNHEPPVSPAESPPAHGDLEFQLRSVTKERDRLEAKVRDLQLEVHQLRGDRERLEVQLNHQVTQATEMALKARSEKAYWEDRHARMQDTEKHRAAAALRDLHEKLTEKWTGERTALQKQAAEAKQQKEAHAAELSEHKDRLQNLTEELQTHVEEVRRYRSELESPSTTQAAQELIERLTQENRLLREHLQLSPMSNLSPVRSPKAATFGFGDAAVAKTRDEGAVAAAPPQAFHGRRADPGVLSGAATRHSQTKSHPSVLWEAR
eukprot:TRINITY_DN28474_c0_g1_i2.p1 TRINITY_DN28474_c0_g1~~TRINITY_DN28474_c0_g1_i2.p1  ORF type:complete len:364 (+),score=95.86 TRINITY_DN28474_c0_g1_i2:72-1163(+)